MGDVEDGVAAESGGEPGSCFDPEDEPGMPRLVTRGQVAGLVAAYAEAVEQARQVRALFAAHGTRIRVEPALDAEGGPMLYLFPPLPIRRGRPSIIPCRYPLAEEEEALG